MCQSLDLFKVYRKLSHEKVKARKVVFNQKKLDNYFDPSMSNEEIENLIVELLDEWKRREEGD